MKSAIQLDSQKTPTVTVAAIQETVKNIPLDLLDVSPFNPRKTFDETSLKELAASIATVGVLQPLLVRPMPLVDGLVEERYEIVAGHRRSEAATIAGKLEVPCIVRQLTDAEARDAALIDNLQRADVPSLEEAEAFGELLTRYGSTEAVAAKVGKDVAHVAKRLKLLTLTAWSQDALRERLITIDHALLLARLGDDDQNAALKWCLDRQAGVKVSVDKVIADRLRRLKPKAETEDPGKDEDDDFGEDEGETEAGRPSVWNHKWEPESVQRLKEHIASESGTPLSRAPWPMEEDWLLPDVGSCLDCPNNTKANTPLFGDLDITAPICTDGGCFRAKTEGFVLHGIETAKRDSKDSNGALLPVLRVSWKATSTPPRQIKNDGGINPAQVFKAGQWEEAKKKCEHSRAAVTVDWGDDNRRYMGDESKQRRPGEIVQACIEPACKVHAKTYLKAARGGGNQREKPETEEERKEREEEQAFVLKTERVIRDKVFWAVLDKLDAVKAIHLVADQQNDATAWRKKLLEIFPDLSGQELEAFTVFACEFYRVNDVSSYWMMQPGGVKGNRKRLWALASSVGVKADEVAAKHFHDEKGISRWADRLYPKGIKWPKGVASKPEKKAAAPAKSAAPKKTAKAVKGLTPAAKKQIADAMRKRLATKKLAPRKAVKK